MFNHEKIDTFLQFVIALMTAFLVYFAYIELGPKLSDIQASTALKITHPRTGDRIRVHEFVAGTFVAPTGFVTLVVRDKRGVEYPQNHKHLATLYPDIPFEPVPNERGEWLLPAQFGEQATGCDEPFFLRAVWTQTEVEPGKPPDIGEDAIVTDEVSLLRICGD